MHTAGEPGAAMQRKRDRQEERTRRRLRREVKRVRHLTVIRKSPTLFAALEYCRRCGNLIEPDFFRERPGRAVDYLPGTPEKVAVLRQRLERGESLWHSEDGLDNDE